MNCLFRGLIIGLLIFGVTIASLVNAQESNKGESGLESTLETINTDMRNLYHTNMEFSEKEKHDFWPVYDLYEKAMTELTNRKVMLVKEYYDSLLRENFSGEEALILLEEYFSLQNKRLDVKKSYISKFKLVIPDKKVARFFQLDNKAEAIINYDLVRIVPLVPDK